MDDATAPASPAPPEAAQSTHDAPAAAPAPAAKKGKKKGGHPHDRLYRMDEESIAHLDTLYAASTDPKKSKSGIVRAAVKAYDPRTVEQLKARAAELQAIAEKKQGETGEPAAAPA